mgnify:CR=1 FL=1
MPLILGAQSAIAATGVVTNSCRFNPADDPTLTRSSIGTPTDVNKWTFSAWVKRGRVASDNGIMRMYADDNNYTTVNVSGAGAIEFDNKVSSSFDGRRMTDGKYLDPAAWYHYVMVYDSDNVTGDDRMITYVNGTRITAWGTDSDPGSGSASGLGSGNTMTVGSGGATGTAEWGGYLAEVALCDGQAYAASDFGEFDEDTPTAWKPKAITGLTFGAQGFYLDFEDSSDLGADVSGNGNDFTSANLDATDQATDTPVNNFCTMNPLQNRSLLTFSEGNNKIAGVGDGYGRGGFGTMALSAGKWYFEMNVSSTIPGNTTMGICNTNGIQSQSALRFNPFGSGTEYSYGYRQNGEKITADTSSSYGNTYTQNDIISCAFDITNLKIYFAKNGTWENSGVPTSGATGTGSAFDLQSGEDYMPAQYFDNGPTIEFNFGGCAAFTVSSGNADGNGYGDFEYEPPSGYLAICTKNIGSDGG